MMGAGEDGGLSFQIHTVETSRQRPSRLIQHLLCRVEVGLGKWLDGGRCGREMRLKLSAGTTFDNDQPFLPSYYYIHPTKAKAIDYHLNNHNTINSLITALFSLVT